MSRRANVSQSDFDQCIAVLKKKNITPSVNKVVREIGGSYSTIGDMFSKWQKENDTTDSAQSPVPDNVINDANEMLMKWWNVIQDDATARISQIQDLSAKQIAQAQLEVEPLIEDLTSMEKQIVDLNTSHATTIKTLQENHQLEIKNLKTELSGKVQLNTHLKDALAEKTQEAKKSLSNHDALQKKYNALVDKLASMTS